MAKKTLLDNIIESIKDVDGRLIKRSGTTEQMISDLNYKVVAPARSAADSAVSAADAAVASAQVTSDAVSAIASATAEAKQGANEAMSRAMSAWDVATGAKEAVTDFDPLLKSAQSDAGKALTQIADTASALSDAKTVFGSDVAAAKELANTAQTTANNAIESAGENARALASQANALSDAKKAMDSDVASAKGLANAAQVTADNAVKSASSVANDLATVASQAKANASGITKVISDVGLLQTTVADNSGNISKIQETASQIQQAVSDNAGNITTAKQTANSAVTVASDAKSNATVAVQTASEASVTAKNAQGDATTAMVTSKGAVTQASDAKSNATIAVQTASEASLTATNAKGDASIAKQTASEASVQIKNAQGDISKLQTRAGTIEASVSNNSGAIADVQATANQLKASVSDNAGNITVAKQTADSAVTVASDARSNATVAIQTASQASVTAQNASGQAASAVITANGAMTTASNAQSYATVAVQTASGASLTATNANNDATVAKQTASEAKVQASNAEGDFAQLSIRANKIEANVANNSGAIASVQQTANGLTTTVADITSNGGGRNLWLNSKSFANTNPNLLKVDWNTGSDGIATAHVQGSLAGSGIYGKWNNIYSNNTDPFAIGDSETFSVEMEGTGAITIGRENDFTRTVTLTNTWTRYSVSGEVSHMNSAHIIYNESGKDCDVYVRLPMVEKGIIAHDWSPASDDLQNQFTQIKTSIDGVTTTINDPKTGLNATYQTAAGNATTISNVKSDVYQLETTANGLTSRVGNLESKTNTQQTTIDQNKAAIALKADQTDVNTLKGTVSQNTATLATQANLISSKVTSSDVTGMLNGYATQEYTQSLVTQKADDWNLNLTKLKNDTQTSLTNLAIGVEGVQTQVYNSDGSSKITQLSNLIQSKVGVDDFNNLKQAVDLQTLDSADINNMKANGHYFVHNLANNPIGGWVYVDVTGDGSSRIRQDVYQDIGIKHKYRRWFGTYWTGWEEGATYTEINQLQDAINLRVTKGDLISQINLQAGTSLIQSNKLVLDAETTVFTGNAFIPSAAISSISADKIMLGSTSLWNSDGTLNLVNTKDGTTSKITVTQGNVDFDGTEKNASIIHFASDNNTNAFTITPVGATVTPTLFFERFDQTAGHWLGFTRNETQEEGVMFHTWDDSGERFSVACHARFDKNLRTIGTLSQGSWDGTNGKPEAGVLTIKNGNTIWSGSDFLAVGSNVTNTYTGILAKAFVQQSTLSSKTNIEAVDPKDALDLVNKTDIRSYQYKSDVAQGKTKRYTSLIIDDVNDVSQYCAPDEFTNEERTGRDDGSAVGYLFLAIQELTRRIKTLEEKLNG
ncbi:tail fiber domain-containing protein [Limosilactobacillus fermentum]